VSCVNNEVLKLPDQLLARYFRSGKIDTITKVEPGEDQRVRVFFGEEKPADLWRDLGGGLGYVPDEE
jgi:hypothetical protein